MRSGETFQARATAEAHAAPIWMIGPSRPSDPPDAITASEETPRASEGRRRTVRRPSETTSIMWEIPERERSPKKYRATSPPDEAAGGGQKDAHPGLQRLRAAQDVAGPHQEARERPGQPAEGDRAEAPQEARDGRQDQELGVGIAPEEPPELRRPGRGFRRAHSPSSKRSASASLISSSPPKKKAWEQSVLQNVLPPMRLAQPSQTDLWQIGQRGRA